MALAISDAGIELIKKFEGCRLQAYRDVVNVLTIGFGHTGPDVHEGMEISQAEAEALLRSDLKRFEAGVSDAISGAPAAQGQFDAMTSLSYNIGVGAFKRSTVAEMHKAGNYLAAAEAFSMWVKAGGKVYAGLMRRRQEEADLYLRDVDEAAAVTVPFARIKRIQGELGVVADGRFGPISLGALNQLLVTAGQKKLAQS